MNPLLLLSLTMTSKAHSFQSTGLEKETTAIYEQKEPKKRSYMSRELFKYENPPRSVETYNNVNYYSISDIHPGQNRYSSKNVEAKAYKIVESERALWNEEKGQFIGKYNDGKSIFSEKKALPVIRAPFGFVLIDGHHHVLAAHFLGLESIPVKVVADYSGLSTENFWKKAEEKGWAYPYDKEGNYTIPPSDFDSLIDDPNRYFAAITAKRSEEDTGENYLWIKQGKGIPFIEFRISDALWQAGFVYDKEKGLSSEDIEKARAILDNAKIPGLDLIN